MKRPALAPFILAMLLPACATTSGRDFPAYNTLHIHSGVTDKATVQQLLGKPYAQSVAADGNETWSYAYTTPRPNTGEWDFPDAASFYKGLFGTLPAWVETRKATITFQGELVSSCRLLDTSTPIDTTTGAMAWANRAFTGAAPYRATAQQTTCGDQPNESRLTRSTRSDSAAGR